MKNRQKFPIVFSILAALTLVGCSTNSPSLEAPSSSTAPSSASTAPSSSPLTDLSADMVASASIPSMCGFPEGKLSKGVLQKKHPEYPNASVPSIADTKLIVAGDLTGDGVKDLAAVFYCDKGGVSWPSHIQLFQNTAKGIAALGKPFLMGDITGGARGIPSSLRFVNGQLEAVDRQLLPMEPAAAPSGKIKASLKWDGKKLITTEIQDLAHPKNGTLKTATVNGTWCQLTKESKIDTKDCLEINYPQLIQKGEDPRTLDYSSNNDFTELSYFDAPLGVIYQPGVKIQDPANPSVPTAQLDQYRLYNSQTQEVYVRRSK
ncbi:hypothetical protein [Arthrobacter sp. NIO-1057]|uniref:hypothetical protein n=1 Tax=Arthrobacter sp. NIO-1057 TaxID=993071 RepID=UPI000817D038|nr:hypothetical protein [Arthrobacter sp. NIO-1057]SCC46402.1 hypothetical protein GA0061084_2832 [Arthrobacter sp. NIO-1057]